MSRMLRAITFAAAVVAVVAPVLAQPSMQPSVQPGPIATEQLGGTILTVAPTISYEKALLRVSGPDSYVLTQSFNQGQITVDLAAVSVGKVGGSPLTRLPVAGDAETIDALAAPGLVDGRYGYEVIFTGADGKTQTFTGMFFVEGGSAVSREAKRSELTDVRGDLAGLGESSGSGYTETTNVDDFLAIFDTQGDAKTIAWWESDFPTNSNWHLRNEVGDMRFREYDGGPFIDRVTIEAGGQVGIGTTAPSSPLHLVGSGTQMIRMNGAGGQTDLRVGSGFGIYDDVGEFPFIMQNTAPSNTIWLEGDAGNPQVGIGTSAPENTLHVVDTDPQVFVESNGPVAQRVLFRLSNQGKVRFSLRNEEVGKIWTFDNGGNFTISRAGTGVNEFTFFDNGNMTMLGTLTQNSDRNTKEDIAAVDPAEVLEKVTTLPIATWRKIGDKATHLGPMAQDFSAIFGLGINKRTIAPVDMAGVSLAAIQALKAENEALKARLADLEEAVAALAEH